jgi:hypothetical protein
MANYYVMTEDTFDKDCSKHPSGEIICGKEYLLSKRCSYKSIANGEIPTNGLLNRQRAGYRQKRKETTIKFLSSDENKLVGSSSDEIVKKCKRNIGDRIGFIPSGNNQYRVRAGCSCRGGERVNPDCGAFGPNKSCCRSGSCAVAGNGSGGAITQFYPKGKYGPAGVYPDGSIINSDRLRKVNGKLVPTGRYLRKDSRIHESGGISMADVRNAEMKAVVGKNWERGPKQFEVIDKGTTDLSINANISIKARFAIKDLSWWIKLYEGLVESGASNTIYDRLGFNSPVFTVRGSDGFFFQDRSFNLGVLMQAMNGDDIDGLTKSGSDYTKFEGNNQASITFNKLGGVSIQYNISGLQLKTDKGFSVEAGLGALQDVMDFTGMVRIEN